MAILQLLTPVCTDHINTNKSCTCWEKLLSWSKDIGCWSIQKLHRILEPKTEVVVFIKKGILSMTFIPHMHLTRKASIFGNVSGLCPLCYIQVPNSEFENLHCLQTSRLFRKNTHTRVLYNSDNENTDQKGSHWVT